MSATSKGWRESASRTSAGEATALISKPSPLSSRRMASITAGWSSAMSTRSISRQSSERAGDVWRFRLQGCFQSPAVEEFDTRDACGQSRRGRGLDRAAGERKGVKALRRDRVFDALLHRQNVVDRQVWVNVEHGLPQRRCQRLRVLLGGHGEEHVALWVLREGDVDLRLALGGDALVLHVGHHADDLAPHALVAVDEHIDERGFAREEA